MGCFRNRNLFLFGIILALLINTKGLKYKAFWRTIFVITMAVPPFVSLLIMRNLLNGSGPINALLLNWGLIDSSIPFLTDPNWAKLTIIVVNMWIGIPATMLISTGIIKTFLKIKSKQLELTVPINGKFLKVLRFHKFYL